MTKTYVFFSNPDPITAFAHPGKPLVEFGSWERKGDKYVARVRLNISLPEDAQMRSWAEKQLRERRAVVVKVSDEQPSGEESGQPHR